MNKLTPVILILFMMTMFPFTPLAAADNEITNETERDRLWAEIEQLTEEYLIKQELCYRDYPSSVDLDLRNEVFRIKVKIRKILNEIYQGSAFIESGNYLEKHQWGALEEVLAEYSAGKLTLEEAGRYGMYIVMAQDSERQDRDEKRHLIPQRFNLDKKSSEAGPYFFIGLLYQMRRRGHLPNSVIDLLIEADWSDEFICNELKSIAQHDDFIRSWIADNYDDDPYSSDTFPSGEFYSMLLENGFISQDALKFFGLSWNCAIISDQVFGLAPLYEKYDPNLRFFIGRSIYSTYSPLRPFSREIA